MTDGGSKRSFHQSALFILWAFGLKSPLDRRADNRFSELSQVLKLNKANQPAHATMQFREPRGNRWGEQAALGYTNTHPIRNELPR